MKNGKKPTLAQKKFLQDTGLDSEKWLIVKDTPRGDGHLSAELPCRGGVEKQDYQKGEEMSEKSDVKVPEEIRKGWEEARLCANLIREGKAKIMIATRKDGTTYRYTKPK